MDDIILRKIVREKNVVKFDFEVTGNLKDYFTTNQLFMEYDVDVSSLPDSILAIPFVNAVIGLTWVTHSVLWVKELDSTFYDSLKDVKVAYQELYPHYKFGGRLVASYKINNRIDEPEQSSAILLFSGGIDAHTSFLRNKDKNLSLLNVQGGLSYPGEESKPQIADYLDISTFATNNNLRAFFVKSNFISLVNNNIFQKRIAKKLKDSWWHGIVHSMAFISFAIPLAYLNNIPQIIIASSFTVGDKDVGGSYPTVDAEYRFAGGGYVLHDGFDMTRQEKVRHIVQYQKKSGRPYPIRVCSFNDHNCCVCHKCFRTIVEIISEGGNVKDFGFDKIDGNITNFYINYLKKNFIHFGANQEARLYYPEVRQRAKENWSLIEEKEFMEWFSKFDFVKERKIAVLKYRITNLFPLLYKKLLKNN